MKKKRDLLFNRKIWSRRSSISPEFVDCSVRIYNGKTPVRCKITEGKVGHKFGDFPLDRYNAPPGGGACDVPSLFQYDSASREGQNVLELCEGL